jgi:capsule polysaccharide modification protein KpsS
VSNSVIIAIIAFILAVIAIIYNLFNIYYKNLYNNYAIDNAENKSKYLLIFTMNRYTHYKEFDTDREFEKFLIRYKSNISVIKSIKIKSYDEVQLE